MTDPALADRILDLIEIAPGDRILHIGCGDGAMTRRLAGLAPSGLTVGVDESDEMVRQARKLSIEMPNLMFVLGSTEEIPWKEDFFSLLLCEGGGAPAGRAAGEMARVLAPGGRAYIVGRGAGWPELLAEAGFDPVRPHAMGEAFVIEAGKPTHRDHRPALFALK